jgi:threonine dehydratase
MLPDSLIHEAVERITPHILRTPLDYDPDLDLYLKWENRQRTGSFKVRGALNKVLSLREDERSRGLVTASAGNHGQGVALAAQMLGLGVTIFASEHAIPSKILAMRALGAQVVLVPGGYGESELAGIEFARSNGAVWISPYNDELVIAGQATLGLEICNELPSLDNTVWVVPAGGGGLVSGLGAALQSTCRSFHDPGIEIAKRPRLIAVQSEASPFLYGLYQRGTQDGVIELPSLADGLAGPVEDGSLSISMVKNYVDEFILVSEAEIAGAIAEAWNRYHERIEGSAAAALAAALFGKVLERPAVVIITGGNIQDETFAKIIK